MKAEGDQRNFRTFYLFLKTNNCFSIKLTKQTYMAFVLEHDDVIIQYSVSFFPSLISEQKLLNYLQRSDLCGDTEAGITE